MSTFLRLRDGASTSTSPVSGRVLQNGTCSCNDQGAKNNDVTVRLLAVGGQDHYLNFVPNRFSSRAAAFKNRTGITVEVIRLGDLDNLNEEILADVSAKVYDGYVFLPFLTGSLVEQGGLADLTDFVRTNQDVNWLDIFRFNREVQSVYDNVVRLLPCDGDVHSMYYRKDLFEEHDIQVPRTWDEYSATAEYFHGMQVPKDGSNETVTLSGSCVGRLPTCLDFGFFNLLVHSTSTQALGTNTGAFFDPAGFEPLMGEALAETLRHLENQIRFGAGDELTNPTCSGLNIDRMNEGTCAMTYMWGDSFARHLLEGSVLEGKLGIAPTPGVTRVLDRDSGELVDCTEDICPFGTTYEDIGRVNQAPYAAAGGWSVGVSAGVSSEHQAAMADFFGFACGEKESIKDVIPFAKGPLFTGTDPFRQSHFNIDEWEAKGYPRETTMLYRDTIEAELNASNTVLDVRFPEASTFLAAMHSRIFIHLNESLTQDKTFEDRMEVSASITEAWREITRDYDDSRSTAMLSLEDIYRKSLNVYDPPTNTTNTQESSLDTGAIIGIVLGCSVFAALVSFFLAFSFIKREREKSWTQWQIRKDEIRLTGEVIGEGSFGVILMGSIRGTPVAVKPSRHMLARSDFDSSQPENQPLKLSQRQLRDDLNFLVKLRHPQIVQTIGALVDKKSILVVFEYMEHGSLSEVLADASSVAGREGLAFELQWALQIAKGIEFLHDYPSPNGPLLHEDLKASNVMVDASYNAKLSNFAVESRVVGARRDQGSLLWTAPEILGDGEKNSTSSDVYSFGMVLYEIMARSRPFRVRRNAKTNVTECTTLSAPSNAGDDVIATTDFDNDEYFGSYDGEKLTVPELLAQVSDPTIEPPVRPELPAITPTFIRDICVECWHKNPNRRPSASEIVARVSKTVDPTSLTEQLAVTSNIFDSILPHHVQQALSRKEKVAPQSYSNVTVIFSDIVAFTATSALLTADEVGDLIGRLFTRYDKLAEKYGVKKLDVIGDAFLGCAGIPEDDPDNAARAAAFALEAIEEAKTTPICHTKPSLGCVNIRFGLATGPVVASVIGSAGHPKYTLFGTTVNTASRMESSSEPNRVQCTEETAKLIQEQQPSIGVQFRENMDIKGRGKLDTYFLSAPSAGFGALRPARSNQRARQSRRSMGDLSRSLGASATSTSWRASMEDNSTMLEVMRSAVAEVKETDIGDESSDGGLQEVSNT